jgi:urease accessory protein
VTAAAAAQAPQLQRSLGSARLRVERGDGRERVADLFQASPCRILFPDPRPGDPLTAITVTTTGGLTGGDSIAFAIAAGADARLTVASQAAEKIYRSLDAGEVAITINLAAGERAWLEWLMQETILFDGARLARETVIDCAPGATVLATEALVLGRTAAAERFTRGHCLDRWTVRREGRPVWIDAQLLDGETLDAPFGLDGRIALATVLLVGEAAAKMLDTARCCIATWAIPAFASVIDCCLVVRIASPDAQVARAGVQRLAELLRQAVAGLPAQMPAVWRV